MSIVVLVLLITAFMAIVYWVMSLAKRQRENQHEEDRGFGDAHVEAGRFAEPSDEVKELARDPGNKIDAIKAYREQTGVGLREAKDVVEALARSLRDR